jgi:hypothetical protein
MARRTYTTFTIVVAALTLCAVSASAQQKHMQQALDHLSRAEKALEAAKANKDGHRKKALEQIYKAEDELHQGMQMVRDKAATKGHGDGKADDVDLQDLVGAKASGLDSTMERRGFSNTGGHKKDGAAYTTWYNRSAHQCAEAKVSDGRIDSIKSLGEGKCK